jgi:hypothetical protein
MSAPRILETKKPAKRYTPSAQMLVTAKTIGTKIDFKMPISNMSETGMLLTWTEDRRVPFSINTILEVEVVGESNLDKRNISCLAKVIHTTKTPEGSQRFGVKIIQADEEGVGWQDMIREIGRQELISKAS